MVQSPLLCSWFIACAVRIRRQPLPLDAIISLGAPRRTIFLKIRLFGAKTLNFEQVEPVRRRDRFRRGAGPSIYCQ